MSGSSQNGSQSRTPRGYRWVDTDDGLAAVIDELLSLDRYAIDTEFHRERTYFPSLALVQLGWEDDIVLVDPLAVDATALQKLFDSDTVAVFHAAQQDLDVLSHAVGAVPRTFFDTQIAGGFLGYGTPSLVALVSGELGIRLPKGDRLTDWLQRPLSEAQLLYAAADVEFLLELTDRMEAQLAALGRTEWVRAMCIELGERPVSGTAPEEAWKKLKDVRSLRGSARSVAQSVAAWREREAMKRNIPVRQVLPDLAILAVAQRKPTTLNDLRNTRGVDERVNRSGIADAVLEAIAAGLAADPPAAPTGGDDLERSLRPAVALISAWVSQVAKQERIDTALLATRADLVALLSNDPDARLAHGWRNEMLGSGIEKLLDGKAGLTFDAGAGLRLVEIDAGSAS